MRERVKWIKSWETEPKASARLNQVQWRVFLFFRAWRRREFNTVQCSMQPLMPERKAFWRVGSISLFVRRKDWKREARMR